MNATKLPLFALCAGAALAAAAADVCYEGRLLDASGAVRANETLAATLRAYETEDAAEAFAEAAITIATDDEGLFAATAAVDVPAGQPSFWIGVAPEGRDEIRPRMHVLPAPFAVVAASAELLESDGTLHLPGSVTVHAFADGASVTATNAALQGRTTLCGDVTGAKNVYIRDLDAGNGRLSMLRTQEPDRISTLWDEFAADRTVEVKTTSLLLDDNDERPLDLVAEDDGFAMVMIKAEIPYYDPGWFFPGTGDLMENSYAAGSLENGDFGVFSARLQQGTGSCTRLFTFPVRRGKRVHLELQAHRDRDDVGYVQAWAKVKMVYVGAK